MSANGDYNRHGQRPGAYPPSDYYGRQLQQGQPQQDRFGSPQPGSYGGQYGAYGATSSSQQSPDSQSQSSGGSGRSRRRGGLVGGLVRGVAAGIGLASETYHHHQEKKKAAAGAGESSRSLDRDGGGQAKSRDADEHHHEDDLSDSDEHDRPMDPETSRNMDEATWQLDDAQFHMMAPPDYAESAEQDVDTMADRFLRTHHGFLSQQLGQHALAMPVILPQRRPGERARGFIHAYAPLLQDVGIDQKTFMDFVKELNLATMPSPWINAINVATIAVQHVPMPVTIAVSVVAHFATQAGLQAHSRSKTNVFIDKINEEFFRPRGLIAVIMTWKPSQAGQLVTQVNFDSAVQQAVQSATPGSGNSISHRMQASHATTNFEWPESAPLVFPGLDQLASTAEGREAVEEAAKKPNGMLRGMLFAMEYMDKRAQAQWSNDNPDSRLAQMAPKPEFHSRYADPNHPASSGSLLALLTGGAIGGRQSDRKQYRSDRRLAKREQRTARRDERRAERGPTLLGTIGPMALLRGVKKFLHEDVLYLMITNLPSPEEMAAAQQFLNQQQPTQGYQW